MERVLQGVGDVIASHFGSGFRVTFDQRFHQIPDVAAGSRREQRLEEHKAKSLRAPGSFQWPHTTAGNARLRQCGDGAFHAESNRGTGRLSLCGQRVNTRRQSLQLGPFLRGGHYSEQPSGLYFQSFAHYVVTAQLPAPVGILTRVPPAADFQANLRVSNRCNASDTGNMLIPSAVAILRREITLPMGNSRRRNFAPAKFT